MISFVSKHAEMREGLKYTVNFFVGLCASITAAAITLFSIHRRMYSADHEEEKKSSLFNIWQAEFENLILCALLEIGVHVIYT